MSAHRSRQRLVIAVALAAGTEALGVQPPPEPAPAVTETLPEALESDGPVFVIDRFGIRYVHGAHPQLPRVRRLLRLEVELGRTASGYVAPRQGVPTVSRTLDEVEARPEEPYHASAVQTILETILGYFVERGYAGVYVGPDPQDIDATGRDLRPGPRKALRILITTALVTEVRTLASGDRIDPQVRLDHPAHRRIGERSPIRPHTQGDAQRMDVLRRDELEGYIHWLSRHPGRRVEAAVSPGIDPATVTLDYRVIEAKPLTWYAQIANTGTDQTSRLRQRFGLVHTQLTDQDDILSLQYITTGFDEVNVLVASYEAPVAGTDRLRARAYAGYNEFTASEVGAFGDVFTGESWVAGLDVTWNVWQHRDLFVDAVAGARFEHILVDNQALASTGSEGFLIPHLGLRVSQETRWFVLSGALFAEWIAGSVTPPDAVEINRMRIFADTNWGILRWDLGASAYLEPLIDREAWRDPTTPASSTLAHEVALSFRGQYAFENRLIPQHQQVIGGFTSVRGYPESVIAADTALVGGMEYRFHLPRALPLDPDPPQLLGRPFRVAPQVLYGRPDWDLVLKGFLDVGAGMVTDRQFFEAEATLVGAGVGVDLVYRQSLRVRLDWGFALREIDSRGVKAGSNRVHFRASLYF